MCDRRSWREVGARLAAAGRDVVAYDRRGFGEVPPAARPFRHVDDLLAVLDAVSPDAPAWLVGSSMGGGVALDAALEAPERVAGLVLLAPAVSGDPELDDAAYIAATNGLAEAIDAAWTAGDARGVQPARGPLVARRAGRAGGTGERSGARAGARHEPHRDRQRASPRPTAPAASTPRAACARSRSRRSSRAASSTSPLKVRRSAELADALPNAAFRSLPGRAHLPYLEAPDEIAALILGEAV